MRMTKYFVSVFLLIALTQLAWAQYAPLHWDEQGIRIRQGYHIEWQRSGEKDADGNVVYTWSDTRFGDRDVFAQKVDASGNMLWDEDGAVIISHAGRQEDPSLIPTGFGDYIFIWNDFRDDVEKGDLYAQKVDGNGNVLWDPLGVLLSTGDFDSPAVFRIVADGTGGAIILWNDLRNGDEGDIYAIRVLSDGTVPTGWDPNGTPVMVAGGGQRQLTVDTDGAGGAIIGWMDNQATQTTLRDIYIQRVTINGELAWGPEGVAVCRADNDQESPKLCPDGAGGAYITWKDKRSDFNGDIYFHHVDNEGNLTFPEEHGKPLIVYDGSQIDQRIVADGSGNAIIIWLDTRNDPMGLSKDIYAQKVNSDGDLLWDPNGNAVCTQIANQDQARINADGAGGAICVWMDERDGNENPRENIFAQKINGNGTTAWTADGVLICDGYGSQYFPLVRAYPNYSLIAWGDERTGSKGIWYQLLDESGNSQLTANGDILIWGISGDADNIKLVKNGQEKVFIFWQDLREGPKGYAAYVQIVDTNGNVYLEQDGIPICPDPIYTDEKGQSKISVCSDGDGGAIAVWEDERDSNSQGAQIYAQRVGSDGTLYWGDSGLQVSPYDVEQNNPQIVEDGSGGGIVAWSEYSLPYFTYRVSAAKISHSGSPIWSIEVVNNPTANDELQNLVPDGEGGAYICYQTLAVYPDYNLYAQHVDASGNLLWAGVGTTVCAAPGIQKDCRMVSLGPDGVILVWEDQRASASGDTIKGSDLYAQKINADGEIQWAENGIPIIDVANDQATADIMLDDLGNLYIVWQDLRNPATNQDLYIQKLSLDGEKQFPDSGLIICGAMNDQTLPKLLDDGSGGSYTLWADFRITGGSDIYGIHLDQDGELSTETVPGWNYQWVENGNIVCDAPNKQNNHEIIDDYQNGVITVWEDKRSSGKEEVKNLYAQRLNGFVVGIEPNQPGADHPVDFALYAPYPNPFNPEVRICYSLPEAGDIRLTVYNLMGREVAVLKEGWHPSGTEELTWRADNLASGFYVIRLEMEEKRIQQKLLLLK